MAGNSIRVSTAQVGQIANELDRLNKQLSQELQQTKQLMNRLSSVWQGEAANMTIQSFNSFSNKYFKDYEDIINQYVKFLKSNVEAGYEATENQNIKLGQQFK